MHLFPLPAASLFSAAMLVVLQLTLLTNSTAGALNTTTPCEPAWCGGLTIAYPFWLAGTHPPECGYQAFQVVSDKQGSASLMKPFWTYQIMDIIYENRSFRVTNLNLSDGTCDFEMGVSASSDLGLAPFRISPRNQELFFLYDCHRQAEQLPQSWALVSCTNKSTNSFTWLAGRYRPDANLTALPGNCTVSVMPVLGYEGATGADYQRLMKRGFLLEYSADGCEACIDSGGRCRFDDEEGFECQCSNGVYPVSVMPLLGYEGATGVDYHQLM